MHVTAPTTQQGEQGWRFLPCALAQSSGHEVWRRYWHLSSRPAGLRPPLPFRIIPLLLLLLLLLPPLLLRLLYPPDFSVPSNLAAIMPTLPRVPRGSRLCRT